jgi:hypothetical protein
MATKTKTEKLSKRQATDVVLLQAGKPLHYREITRIALENGLVRVKKGKRKPDPEATMKSVRSYLCAEEGEKFVRVAPGIFNLTPQARKALKAKAAAK